MTVPNLPGFGRRRGPFTLSRLTQALRRGSAPDLSTTSRRPPPPARRRYQVETLEPRLLLSADLVPGAAQALVDGLDGLANWADELDDFDELAQPLPLIDTPLGDLLDLGGFIQDNLVDPLASAAATTTQEVADALESALDALLGAGDYVTDITDQVSDEYRFTVDFSYELPAEAFAFGVGEAFDALGIGFENTVDLAGSINVAFEFGFLTTGGLDPADAFFIDTDGAAISVGGTIDATINAAFDLGFIDAQLDNGEVDMSAFLDVNLPDAGSDTLLTLAELTDAAIDDSVLTVDGDNSFSASLPVTATLAGLAPADSSANLIISGIEGANLFANPDFSISVNSPVLADFTNIRPGDVAGALQNLGSQLDAISSVLDVAGGIPFLSDGISDITSFAELFDELSQELFDVGVKAVSLLGDLGDLSGNLSFDISVDEADPPVTITIDYSGITETAGLLTALNGELSGLGIEAVLEDSQLLLQATDASIDKFELTSVDPALATVLGLENSMFGLPLFQFATIQEFIGLLNESALKGSDFVAAFDAASNSITFNIDIAKSFQQDVLMNFSESLDLGVGELVLSGGAEASFAVTAALDVGAGIDISTFSGETSLGKLNGGAGIRVADGPDFNILLSDGSMADIDLSVLDTSADGVINGDDSKTVQNLIDTILGEESDPLFGKLEIVPDGAQGNLLFRDISGGGGDFVISVAENEEEGPLSPALIDLGILLSAGGNEDGEIVAGIIMPRFFIQEDSSSISAAASISADDIDLTGALGFLEIGVEDGSLTETTIDASLALQDPFSDGRIFLNELARQDIDEGDAFPIAVDSDSVNFAVTSGTLSLPLTFPDADTLGLDLDLLEAVPELIVTFEDTVAAAAGGLNELSLALDFDFDTTAIEELLASFENLSIGQVIELVLAIGESIAGDFDLFNYELPLVDTSINDILQLAQNGLDQILDGELAQKIKNLRGELTTLLDSKLGDFVDGQFQLTLPGLSASEANQVLAALDAVGLQDEFFHATNNLLSAIAELPENFDLITAPNPTELIAAFNAFLLVGKRIAEEDLPGVDATLEDSFQDLLAGFTDQARELVPSTDTVVQLIFEALGFELPELADVLSELDEESIQTLLVDTVSDALSAAGSGIKAELEDFEANLPADVPSVQDAIDAITEAEQIIGRLEGLLEDVSSLQLMDFVRLFGLSDDLLQKIEIARDIVDTALNDPDLAAGALKDQLQAQYDALVDDVLTPVRDDVVAAVQNALGGELLSFRFDDNNNLLINLHIAADETLSDSFELDFDLTGPGDTDIPLNFESALDGELNLAGSLDLGFGLNVSGGTPQIFLQTDSAATLELGLDLEGFAELSIFGLSASFGNPDFPDPEAASIIVADAVEQDDGMGGTEIVAGEDNASIGLSLIDNDGDDDGLILLGDINAATFDPSVNGFLEASLPVYTNGTGVLAPSGPVEVVATDAPDLDFDDPLSFSIAVNGFDPIAVDVPAYGGGDPGDPYPSVNALADAIDTAMAAATFTDLGIFGDGNLGEIFDAQVDGGLLKIAVKGGLDESPSTMVLSGSGLTTLGFNGDLENQTELVNIGFTTSLTAFNSEGFDFALDGLSDEEVSAIIGSFTELNLANLFAAIDTILQVLEDALGSDFIDGLPVLDDAADVIGNGVSFLQDAFDAMKSALEEVPDAVDDLGEWVNEQLATAITNAVGAAEGAAGAGVDLLLDLVPDIRFTLDGSDIDTADFDAQDLLSDPNLGVEIDFGFDYGKDFETSFDLGLDALIFEVETEGGIAVDFDAGLDFTLGLGLLTGPYLKFSEDPDTDDIFASLNAGLVDGTSLTARLFFLELKATELSGEHDGVTYEGVNLSGDIGVDLGTGETDINELMFDLSSDLEVDIDLLIEAGIEAGTDGTLPSLEVKMNTDWDYDLISGEVPDLPMLEFNDLSLDVGEFFQNTFGPVLEQLEPFTSALDPIFDILYTEVPVVSDLSKLLGQDPITFLSAIKLLGSGFESVEIFLNVAQTVDQVIGIVDDLATTGKINFGDMDFGGIDLTEASASSALDAALGSVTATSESLRNAFTSQPGTAELVTKAEASAGFDTSGGLGISFDIIENPASLFNLLIGGTADLVTWDIPRLSAQFDFGMSFGPIIPPIPLFATVNLGAELFADFAIGFDTRGLATGSFFNGFYFNDLNEAGEDILELGLGVEASAGAELNVVVASAGVNGGVRAEIGANWNDPDSDGKVYLDELARNFARGVECVFDLEGALSAFFDAFVKIGFDTPFGFVTIFSETLNLLDVTLLDFSASCPPLPPPLPGTLDGDDILLNIGDRAGDRQPGATDGEEEIFVLSEMDRDGDGVLTTLKDINGNGVIERTELEGVEDLDGDGELSSNVVGILGFGQFQLFTDAAPTYEDNTAAAIRDITIANLNLTGTRIIGNGGAEDDKITIDESVVFGADITGGDGNDEIFGGSGNDKLDGDAGEDILRGGLGDDEIHGGADADDIRGNAGSDKLYGDGGDDAVFGEDGINQQRTFVEGEPEYDLIEKLNEALDNAGFAAFGAPTYDDEIEGNDGADDLRGDFGVDIVYGGEGNDNITGGWGNDELTGNDETDLIEGGQGSDKIWGDNRGDDNAIGNDVLFGEGAGVGPDDTGDDLIFGGPGNDTIRDAYDSEEADPEDNAEGGNDSFYGGDGDDLLVTGSGNDRAFGGAGADEIFSGDDNDYVEGGGGADLIRSGAGADLVIGGSSPYADKYNDNFAAVPLSYAGPAQNAGVDGAEDADFAGTDGTDTIFAGSGDDIVIGDNGAFYAGGEVSTRTQDVDLDRVTTFSDGGEGTDTLRGEDGDDILFGGGLADEIFGDAQGGNGNDIGVGDQGYLTKDQLVAVHSSVAGAFGNDTLYGRSGLDILIGGSGGDFAYGNAGADLLAGDNVAIVLGGLGFVPTGANVTVLKVTSTDKDQGGNDTLYGNTGADLAIGGFGSDVIRGGSEDDILLGDNGEVVLDGSAGAGNAFVLGTPVDSVATTDTSETTGDVDTIGGDAGNDIALGGVAGDIIGGNAGDDLLLGDGGEVLFSEGDADLSSLDAVRTNLSQPGGADTISGHDGGDVIMGGRDGDTLYGDGAITGSSDGADVVLGDNGELLLGEGPGERLLRGAPFQTLRTTDTAASSGGADTIEGNAANDILMGGTAGDTINGNDGDDIALGDNGRLEWGYDFNGDAFFDGESDVDGLSTLDIITTELPAAQPGGRDTIQGDDGSDIVLGGTDADALWGDEADGAGTAGSNDDLIFGDHGAVYPQFSQHLTLNSRNFFAIDTGDGDGGEGDQVWGEGGDDIILGQQGDDRLFGGNNNDDLTGGHNVAGGIDELSAPAIVTTGSDVSDIIDGGSGDDALAGDNALIWRNDGDVGERYRALEGTLLYETETAIDDPDYGDADVTGTARGNPDGGPGRTITLLDHADGTAAGLYGNDYLAGNADNDEIFGQLGDDIVQGDGTIGADDGDPDSVSTALSTADSGGATDGTLYFNVFEAATDGDDYIEGNGGEDLLFGGLGQDDIIGGSSDLFGLTDPEDRPDGSDIIYGGAANPDRLERNATTDPADPLIAEEDRHARDSDMIVGDNGSIYRIVGLNDTDGGAYEAFNYDAEASDRGDLRIVVRGMTRLDYDPEVAANNRGDADRIWGESGDDFIHAMFGPDVAYGDAENDDIFGEQGTDWLSGGTGEDAILGDTGLIATSRNSDDYGEPLYGIAPLGNRDLDQYIDTPGDIQQSIINLSDALKRTVDLTPFAVGEDDIIYGGLGDDSLHGGAGDDAISGAEAMEGVAAQVNGTDYLSGYSTPANPGGVLGFDPASEEFALYDEFNPRTKIVVNGKEFLLNFEAFTDANDQVGSMVHDGNDVIFGDLGNDWLVGGTDLDRLYGGYGSDLLNIDDNHDTNGGLNDEPDDPAFAGTDYQLSDSRGADMAYGGAGRDVMINNSGADRMIDWVGEFNSYITPYAPFGQFSVSRSLQPQLQEYLLDLSESDGADPTRAADTGSDPGRNGEPKGELGMVLQKDFDWQEQTGAPNDPQAGNIPGGKRDVMEAEDFDGVQGGQATAMAAESGDWNIAGGTLQGSSIASGDAINFMFVGDQLPSYYEVTATVNADKDRAGVKSNGYVIFDYQGPEDFKFAGIEVGTDKLQIGQRTADGWIIETQDNMRLKANSNHNLLVAVNGTTVTLVVDGQESLSHSFGARVIDGVSVGLNYGMVGVGMNNSSTSFDNLAVQKLPPDITYTQLEDFTDGLADGFAPAVGSWIVDSESYHGDPAGEEYALSKFSLDVAASAYLEIAAAIAASDVAGVAFDHYDDGRFKFAALDISSQQVIIGHFTAKTGFVIDASTDFSFGDAGEHRLEVGLSGTTVSLRVDGQDVLGHVYNALLNDGDMAALVLAGTADFSSVAALTDDPAYGDPLRAESTGEGSETLEEQVLASVAEKARIQWANSGLLEEGDLARLEAVDITLADLEGELLGLERDGTIYIDSDAAGNGWASGEGKAGMDLLTVVSHEIGHALGFAHGELPVMDDTLSVGEQHLLATPEASARSAFLALDEHGDFVASDLASSAGKVTKEILAGRMVDWSIEQRP
ncbi:LEPR-XLL domain-containing protein [Seongchinamella sediminis]|uniref:LEPR-XLL domain-containing protein n=1 Tax=Seongchinamella sediminis TaxID=2283635 RepID=A0A3L7E4P6_9GAMM|nr:LEPR-XLL domain-containing protein [Seongchinamella sediminis]RLQ23593.1 LEPR-XLL domain-containing protein [Seongchinamella sediminis]